MLERLSSARRAGCAASCGIAAASMERWDSMIELGCLEDVEGEKREHDLVLFALSTCGWCRKARDFLDTNDIAYRYVYLDLLEGDEQKSVLDEASKWNPKRTFPTLVIDDSDKIVGFTDEEYGGKLL